MISEIGKYIIAIGILLLIAGFLMYLLGNKLHWMGNLPGDIRIEKPSFKFYFPVTTMLLLSIILNLIIYIIKKLFF